MHLVLLFLFGISISALGNDIVVSVGAPKTARTPILSDFGDQLALAWVEPSLKVNSQAPEGAPSLIKYSIYDKDFLKVNDIVQVENLFVNWADFGKFYALDSKRAFYFWLEKSTGGTYSYNIFIASTVDAGKTWKKIGKLNQDSTPSEHGFVSLTKEGSGVRAFWLDGRKTIDGGPMTLRTALVDDLVKNEELLDSRVCNCCATAVIEGKEGPIVFYRGRSESEVRDIFMIRKTPNGWSVPIDISKEHWTVRGCPVNGPSAVAEGSFAAVGWFTNINSKFQVRAAISNDGGATFAAPLLIDDQDPLGRVGMSLADRGDAVISWLSAKDRNGKSHVMVRRFSMNAKLGPVIKIATVNSGRGAGVPSIKRHKENLFLALTIPEEGIKVYKIPLKKIPAGF